MSVDEVINKIGDKEQYVQRALSLLLFSAIKPYCVELTQLALLPNPIFKSDSQKLISALNNVNRTLEAHYRENSQFGAYRLSANIADYVFYPLSNLLKQPTLNDEVISVLLEIIAFLIRHSWSHNVDVKLLDQLYPLILFLVDNNVGAKGVTVIEKKEFSFKESAIKVINSMVACLPADYFSSNPKNLTVLGSSTTILLDILTSLQSPTTQEEIVLVNSCLETIDVLYSKVSSEQLSHIFPGSVSHLVNFSTNSKSLHFSIIRGILKVLRQLIVKVFSDRDLKISFDSSGFQPDLEKLNELWEDQNEEEHTIAKMDTLHIKLEIPATGNKHRTTSWLFATAKQLKISLTILFRTFLTSQSNRQKVRTKTQVSNELISFVNEILKNCFISLFKDFCTIALDVLSMLVSILTSEETTSIQKTTEEEMKIDEYTSLVISNISAIDTSDKNQHLLYNHVKLKLADFINNKLSSIVFSTDDEKINSYIVSLKFQFSILNKLSNNFFTNEDAVQDLKLKLTQNLQLQFVNCFVFNNQLKGKELFPLAINGTLSDNANESENKLDNIELPPHINAHKLTQVDDNNRLTNKSHNRNAYTDNLLILSKTWSRVKPYADSSEMFSSYFKGIYSPFIENRFVSLLGFIALLGTSNESKSLVTIENLLLRNDIPGNDMSTQYLDKAISLWMANNLLGAYNSRDSKQIQSLSNNDSFDINEFLVFEQRDSMTNLQIPNESNIEEMSYLIMGKAQELIDEVSSLINSPENVTSKNKIQLYKIYEFAYAVAIDSIGQLANHLPLSDFQTDFLIDYLYPLLEALTYQSNSLIQIHAASSLESIVQNYYNGSLELLVMDNLDYLIDCLSLKLSVVSTLTPALPGILLIVLKIAGIKLLLTNQLLDILTKMFILIDSYHGYSALVEGFFIVFEELIQQVKDEYLKQEILPKEESDPSINTSLYKPWGLSNCTQLLALIDDSNKLIDPMNDYDSNKEYFRRKPDTAFGDQLVDSDDEEDEANENDETSQSDDQEVWNSRIPKDIYFIVQKIFNYGFRLLSHPSTNLRIQIIKTLINIYPILAENHLLLLPVISQHWPVLLTLISGASSLSTFSKNDPYDYGSDNIIVLALEFVIKIVEEDKNKGERFLAKKFVEIWEHLSNNSKISSYIKNSNLRRQSNRQKQLSTLEGSIAPSKLIQLYVKFIITGMNTYERAISDLTAYDMVKFCYSMGLSKDQYMVKEVQNILWVIEHETVL